eukprot:jgi/Chrzof1/3477/Cz12g26290.t1
MSTLAPLLQSTAQHHVTKIQPASLLLGSPSSQLPTGAQHPPLRAAPPVGHATIDAVVLPCPVQPPAVDQSQPGSSADAMIKPAVHKPVKWKRQLLLAYEAPPTKWRAVVATDDAVVLPAQQMVKQEPAAAPAEHHSAITVSDGSDAEVQPAKTEALGKCHMKRMAKKPMRLISACPQPVLPKKPKYRKVTDIAS